MKSVNVKMLKVGNSITIPITKLLTDDYKMWEKITVEVQKKNKKSFVLKVSERIDKKL